MTKVSDVLSQAEIDEITIVQVSGAEIVGCGAGLVRFQRGSSKECRDGELWC